MTVLYSAFNGKNNSSFCLVERINGEKLFLTNSFEGLKKEGLKCKLAENPTHYLCNEAYYYILKKVCRRALFIHIPPLKNFSNDMAEAIIKAIQ